MEGATEWLAQTILGTLSIPQLQAWIRRQGLGHDIQLLESEVEMVDMVCAAVRDRAAGNKPLARLEGALYDADDLVDELDYHRLLDLNLDSPPATASLVVGRNDTAVQSAHAGMLVQSSTADSPGNGLSQHDDIYGAVVVDNNKDNKSRTDGDIRSRQRAKTRSAVWQYFEVSEADEFERPAKAKCVKCGSELNCGSKYGTSGLKRHIRTEACGKKKEAAEQALIPSSSTGGTGNGETVALGDSRHTKRKRMDDESTHATKAKTQFWNKVEYSHRIRVITRLLQGISRVLSKVLKLHGTGFVASSNQYPSKTSNQHLRTSSVVPRKVYGRVAEKDYIINFMREYKPDGLYVLPIVGSAGIGKTTLAQLVYNDPTMAERFDQRIWVSVSNNFDEVRLSKEILDCVSQQTHEGLCSFSKLQEVLKMHITSKRILLIFDDVWDDFNLCRWSQLLAPLQSNTKGTVILLTTRNLSVAQTVCTVEPFKLCDLAYEEFWSLFKSCAFGDENYGSNQNLSSIGLRIAEKLKGNPLAAVTVGGLLRMNLTIDHWNNILKNEDWKSLQLNGGIMTSLKRSYDQLPYHLQQCFLFCSIFPERYQFLDEELVQIWISMGYVKCDNSSKRLEEKGMDYLADLVNLGFFEQVEREDTYPGSQTCYVICGLMHDFARVVSRTECATIDGLQCCEMLPTIRHLSVVSDPGYSTDQHASIPSNKKSEKNMFAGCTSLWKLRTLVFIGQYDMFFFKSSPDIFQGAHNLRLLQISAAPAGLNPLLCSLVNLKHLRYLDIKAADGLGALPQILSKFCHLEVLHVGSYTNPTMPVRIDHIFRLRHLVTEEEAYSSIANIGNLTSLQELPNFVVQTSSGYEIRQLQSMKELVQLGVSQLENVKTREEAYGAGLRDKNHLEKLHLSWKGASPDDEYDSDLSSGNDWLSVEVLEGLQPPTNLKHLQISGYSGQLFPTWLADSISVTSLQTLHIESCGKLEIFPSLVQLPFLRTLKLMAMISVTEVSFPSLEELVLIQMPKLVRCSCISTLDLSSNLRFLHIKRCPALKIFPLFEVSQKFIIKQKSWLPSIRELIIHGCPNLLVPRPLPPSITISKLSIVDVPTLPRIEVSSGDTLTIGSRSEGYDNFDSSSDMMTVLDREILAFHNLRGLRYLRIDGCQNLVYISFTELVQLISLKSLEICCCRKLFSSKVMPEHTREDVTAADRKPLPSLVTLRIKCCGIVGKWLSLMLGYVLALAELLLEDCPGITQLAIEEEENIQSYCTSVPVDSSSGGLNDTFFTSSAQDGLLSLPPNLMSSLKRMSIRECPRLVFCGNNKGLSRFTCLEKLTIWGCPGLLSSLVDKDGNDDEMNGRWLLPKSLVELEIRGDSPEMLQPCFPENVSCLKKMEVWFSPSLRSLQLRTCMALEELIIVNCRSLAALESLQLLDSLRHFKVFRSPGMLPCLENLSLCPGLERLVIDDPSVFTVSICKQLTSLQRLELEKCEFVTRLTEQQERGLQLLTSLQELEFRDCHDLKYLPGALHRLPSLKKLKINGCLGISRLPEQGLPLSLQELDISNCSKVFNDHCKSLAAGKLKVKIVGNTETV
ncbi:putative disease resistance protein At3g14460 isoform X1 [Aegilops tauschii subsp. strangulata]|uniref:BED-type domain-containing protein n=3 Tax=Aegilops tauschii subsp. strangulata TaxID=200361 RepID=A0A453MJB2_AEGTS|nr:putative disease resistance protein RGA4 isoform X1 [Aegilops tauschii subsp. strangulata]XP_020180870.1 putative disease resistance protein RGA4 isoform X1 [Aegilops tauschii subsp. strangulata]XP_040247232.1 putative disease resistance protein RGA4 isoform X1 [Aegilops tauschii subsp. strangulata]